MKNLEDYRVNELSSKEMKKVNGGLIFLYFVYRALTNGGEEEESNDGWFGGGSFGGGGASGSW
jgi:bacteriocin-like protein